MILFSLMAFICLFYLSILAGHITELWSLQLHYYGYKLLKLSTVSFPYYQSFLPIWWGFIRSHSSFLCLSSVSTATPQSPMTLVCTLQIDTLCAFPWLQEFSVFRDILLFMLVPLVTSFMDWLPIWLVLKVSGFTDVNISYKFGLKISSRKEFSGQDKEL